MQMDVEETDQLVTAVGRTVAFHMITESQENSEGGNSMNLALWIVTGLLAAAYLFSGVGKLIMSREKIAAMSHGTDWVEDFSPGTLKIIGVLEVLAAVGLVLPALLDIAPVLVPLAAVGLVLLMAGAVITRLRRREFKPMLGDLVYLALAAFVAWGRLGPESFTG